MSVSNNDSTILPLTNDELIAKAIDTLEKDNKTDTSLLEVLSEHIVQLNPKTTAVSDAAREIEVLAEKRAETPEDDHANHD